MPKVINAKNWNLTPAADGRRYSKYPAGDAGFSVSAYTSGVSSDIAYRIYDPVALTWSAWIDGESGGVGGTVTRVSGTPLAGPFAFTNQTDVALYTVIESNAIAISSEGHELQLRRRSSANNSTLRTAVAVVGGVQSAAWSVTTQASVDPPGDFPSMEARQDILLCVNFTSFTSDEVNRPRESSGAVTKPIDGFRVSYIADQDPTRSTAHLSQAALDLPHYEIKGGVHCLPGQTRAGLLTVYPPNHVPLVDYNNGEYLGKPSGRSRIDGQLNPYMSSNALFGFDSIRYGLNNGRWNGYYEEFWIGFAFYLPSTWQWDEGELINHAYFALGNPGFSVGGLLSMS